MPPETDNLLLQEIFEADQKDRTKVYTTPAGMEELRFRDRERLRRVHEMMSMGQINTALDLYHAGVIYQHGSEPQEFLTAHRMANLSAMMGHRPARWLSAAALDRFLMSLGLSQVYGTQFEHNTHENRYQLRLPIDDSRVLSFEKRFLDVPLVADRLSQLNGRIGVEKQNP